MFLGKQTEPRTWSLIRIGAALCPCTADKEVEETHAVSFHRGNRIVPIKDDSPADQPGASPDNDATEPSATIVDIKAQQATSADIDRALRKQKKADEHQLKILMLGGADAGKSTIVRQMRILHMNGYNLEEKAKYGRHLRYNLFQIAQSIALGVKECIASIQDCEVGLVDKFADGLNWILDLTSDEEIELLRTFLELDCVRHFLELNPSYPSLPDNAQYYMPNISSLLSNDYIPSPEDILHLRITTTVVDDLNFTFRSHARQLRHIRLIDVGGQRAQRKKWMRFFDGVTAVLFVASMAAYDQILDDVDGTCMPINYKDIFTEKSQKDRTRAQTLRESAHLFRDMLNCKPLRSSAFILFLNKKDLFANKLQRRMLGNHMTDYKGDNSYADAAEHIKNYFLKRKSPEDRRRIFSHYTCATNTDNVKHVFDAVCTILLEKSLISTGMQ